MTKVYIFDLGTGLTARADHERAPREARGALTGGLDYTHEFLGDEGRAPHEGAVDVWLA